MPGGRAPTTFARVREIFAGAPFRRYVGGRFVSQCGDGIFQLSSAAVLLFEHPGNNPTIALLSVSAITLVPFSLISPFTGVFIDRWDRRRIVVWVPVLRAVMAATLPLAALGGTHGVAFYVVVLLVLSTNRFFLATMSAILPHYVPEDDLIVANATASAGGAVANVVGQGIGSVLSSIVSGATAGLGGAALFATTAAVTRTIDTPRTKTRRTPIPVSREIRRVLSEMTDGLRAMRSNARVVYGMTAIIAVQVMVGAMTAVLTYYFIHVRHLKVGSVTSVLAVLAIGIGIGLVIVPVLARRVRHDLLLPLSFAIGAVANGIAGASLSRTTLLVGAVLAGVSYSVAKIPVDTIVQEEMEDVVRGRAFAVYDMVFNVARVSGVAGVALAYTMGASSRAIVGSICVAYAALGTAFALWGGSRRHVLTTEAQDQDP